MGKPVQQRDGLWALSRHLLETGGHDGLKTNHRALTGVSQAPGSRNWKSRVILLHPHRRLRQKYVYLWVLLLPPSSHQLLRAPSSALSPWGSLVAHCAAEPQPLRDTCSRRCSAAALNICPKEENRAVEAQAGRKHLFHPSQMTELVG